MSGPSTLRICLAAMAPALTEAASARLRLHDSTDDSNENTRYKTIETSRTLAIGSSGENKVLGGRITSKGERQVTHLSLSHFDSKQSDLTSVRVSTKSFTSGEKGPKLYRLTRAVPPSGYLGPCKSPTTGTRKTETDAETLTFPPPLKSDSDFPFYITEDFQESNLISQSPIPILKNLKIMNQPTIGIGNNKIENEISKQTSGDGFLMSQSQAQYNNKMVNGEGENDSGVRCDERGDAPIRNKHVPNTQNKRSVRFDNLEKLELEPKRNPPQTDKSFPEAVASLCGTSDSNMTHVSELEKNSSLFMDQMDMMKSRDEVRKECARKQAHLERKVETLVRRLKRMRGKVVETHSRDQLRQFVTYQHRSLQNVAKVMRSEAPGPAELKEHFLSNEEVKSMSTTELVKLVKTYQPLSSKGRSLPSFSKYGKALGSSVMDPALRGECYDKSERLAQRVVATAVELDSDATASSSGGESGDEDCLPAGALSTGVEQAHSTRPKIGSNLPPLSQRAEWRWASDRAGVVSRWTWLQAQVSDLEYRIRQQSQVHRQLRATKGGVMLGDPPSTTDILRHLQGLTPGIGSPVRTSSKLSVDGEKTSTAASGGGGEGYEVSPLNIQAVMSNVDKQASRLTQSLGNCLSPASSSSAATSAVGSPRVISSASSPTQKDLSSPSRTGASDCGHGPPPHAPTELSLASRTSDLLHTPEQLKSSSLSSPPSSSLFSSPSSSAALDATCQSARCRPLRSYRKRRILRTVGLHRHSEKAARLSDVKCRCSPPTTSCPMCGGRVNNTLSMDADMMALRERVALVDAAFHPVLSFPEDVSLTVHCEGLLQSGQWHKKPFGRRPRASHYSYRNGDGLLVSGNYNQRCLQTNNASWESPGSVTANSSNNHHKVLTLATPTSAIEKQGKKQDNGRKRPKKNGVSSNRTNLANGAVSLSASVIKNFSEKIKNKYDSKTKPKNASSKARPLKARNKQVIKKKPSKLSKAMKKKKKKHRLRYTEDDDDEDNLEALYLDQDEYDDDEELVRSGGLSGSTSQSSLKDFSQQQRNRSRKIDNSYDINNIVIPLSMATSIPVEQPQYKEIVTPKWREKPIMQAVSPFSLNKLEKTNGVAISQEQHKQDDLRSLTDQPKSTDVVHTAAIIEEVEDLSDENFASRHLKFEMEEKKRFRNFVQFPPLRRGRARSDLSMDKGGDGIGSEENSLSSRPTTPVLGKSLPSSSSLEETVVYHSQRLRAMSTNSSTPAKREQRFGSREGCCLLEPWAPRSFPLPDDEYQDMLKVAGPVKPRQQEVQHNHETRLASQKLPQLPPACLEKEDKVELDNPLELERVLETALDLERGLADNVAPLSPQSVSASASVSSNAGDDAADPEWAAGGLSSNSSTYSSGSHHKKGRAARILDDPNDPEWLGSDAPRKNKNKR